MGKAGAAHTDAVDIGAIECRPPGVAKADVAVGRTGSEAINAKAIR